MSESIILGGRSITNLAIRTNDEAEIVLTYRLTIPCNIFDGNAKRHGEVCSEANKLMSGQNEISGKPAVCKGPMAAGRRPQTADRRR